MQKENAPLSFSIASTIQEIPRQDWEELFGKDIIEGYGFQRTLEEAGLQEFTIRYLLGKRENRFCLIIPFFIMNFSFDTLVSGPLQAIMKKLKPIFTLKVIFLGAPTAEEFYLGIAKEAEAEALLNGAIAAIEAFSKKEKIAGFLFNNVSRKNEWLSSYLERKGFIKLEGLPSTLIEIKANSVENHIQGLSKNMRKDLKRKLKASREIAKLTTEIRQDIQGISDEVYRLYMNNFSDSDVHFEILTKEFFEKISANMPETVKYFITREGSKIVAFNLCFVKDGLFIDKFIGFDKELALKYHLYFTTFCHNLDWCIKNGLRFYQPGATDYHPKVRLGAKLVPLFLYAKALNPVIDFLIRKSAKLIEPKNIDSSLKEIIKLRNLED
ncbi:MAG: GNAT family N-acetyltransferase [Candidatus Omnitrophica bacterium]|nr:GNAT family N-acetyltransferase [Candidatus Omnitrophota bacterium]